MLTGRRMRRLPPDVAAVRTSLGLACLLALTGQAHAQATSPCETAGLAAERQYALPLGLLNAIGRVESGQWDAAQRRVVPSPFAIDAAGQPHLTDSKDTALQRLRMLQANGLRNIDVGCFQINLQAHPAAFIDLAQAFDPVANAQYAARFLTSLRKRFGNWDDAVAAYHSATPARGNPYRQLVYANWTAPEGWRQALTASPSLAAKPVEPVKIFAIGGIEIRVWTPSAAGTAASRIAVTGTASPALPRIITPRG